MMKETEDNDEHDNGRTMSQDSEYDDTLCIPDSLESTFNGNIDIVCFDKVQEDLTDNNTSEQPGIIPFSAIYDPSTKQKNPSRNIFIPGEEVFVKIINNERSVTTNPLNPNLYTIEFKHGPFTWTVKRRYKHVQNLHNQLKIYRASLNIPFPTKNHRERRNSLKNLEVPFGKKVRKGALPRFPNRPEILVPYEQLHQRMQALEEYLNNLLKIDIYKHHTEIINFMEVSHLSFIFELGIKGKEGLVLKRTGSEAKSGCNFCGLLDGIFCIRWNQFCTSFCGTWNLRHLVVKDTFIVYIRPKDGRIQSVILMDNGFAVSYGIYSTGVKNGLQIMNLSRHIVMKCWTRRKAKEWVEFIQRISNAQGQDFIQSNPHNSFAPYRTSTMASWFVDGASYMAAVADALENAQEEIFIADWWLSPEIYMKRSTINRKYWRLDEILKRKAMEGVKIFIMIYKEVEYALGINSFYSKQKLVELCPENIKVFRHPDHARVGVFLWAHHEKIVVVDQTFAFLGGIDLCYGRWDTNEHRLIDLGSSHHSSLFIPSIGKTTHTSSRRFPKPKMKKHVLWALATATNTIAMATTKSIPLLFSLVREPNVAPSTSYQLKIDDSVLLSPPQDFETLKCETPGLPKRNNLLDLARTKVDKVKNNIKNKRKEWINMVYNPGECIEEGDTTDDTRCSEDQTVTMNRSEESLQSEEDYTSKTIKLWIGKDYTNFIVKDFNDLERPYQDSIDRSTTPRMPWHDLGVLVQGASARDVARHFIQRWNAIKLEKAKLNPCYPFLLPKSYKIPNECASFVERVYNVKCQVIRSVSSWSAGFLDSETIEQSIQEAYIQAISKAERYIYIENQFFITLATTTKSVVKNSIGETLLKRILRAHREGSVFRVFVIMPLLPGFEGEVGEASGTALHAITHWNYASISRGKDSILSQLREAGIENPSEYITFHGLRTYSLLNGTLVTELIYVHSKLMIVDDHTVICGSANINDRSMVATRDSEIAVIIHDQEFEEGYMNDIPFPCGKFAGSLRKQLVREHLGVLNAKEQCDVNDFIKTSFYIDAWCSRSKRNTEIYEKVFHCIPTNKVDNFSTLKQYQDEIPLYSSDCDLALEMVTSIKGYLVDFPLDFLCNEDLKPSASTMEGILPTILWT